MALKKVCSTRNKITDCHGTNYVQSISSHVIYGIVPKTNSGYRKMYSLAQDNFRKRSQNKTLDVRKIRILKILIYKVCSKVNYQMMNDKRSDYKI